MGSLGSFHKGAEPMSEGTLISSDVVEGAEAGWPRCDRDAMRRVTDLVQKWVTRPQVWH